MAHFKMFLEEALLIISTLARSIWNCFLEKHFQMLIQSLQLSFLIFFRHVQALSSILKAVPTGHLDFRLGTLKLFVIEVKLTSMFAGDS